MDLAVRLAAAGVEDPADAIALVEAACSDDRYGLAVVAFPAPGPRVGDQVRVDHADAAEVVMVRAAGSRYALVFKPMPPGAEDLLMPRGLRGRRDN